MKNTIQILKHFVVLICFFSNQYLNAQTKLNSQSEIAQEIQRLVNLEKMNRNLSPDDPLILEIHDRLLKLKKAYASFSGPISYSYSGYRIPDLNKSTQTNERAQQVKEIKKLKSRLQPVIKLTDFLYARKLINLFDYDFITQLNRVSGGLNINDNQFFIQYWSNQELYKSWPQSSKKQVNSDSNHSFEMAQLSIDHYLALVYTDPQLIEFLTKKISSLYMQSGIRSGLTSDLATILNNALEENIKHQLTTPQKKPSTVTLSKVISSIETLDLYLSDNSITSTEPLKKLVSEVFLIDINDSKSNLIKMSSSRYSTFTLTKRNLICEKIF